MENFQYQHERKVSRNLMLKAYRIRQIKSIFVLYY